MSEERQAAREGARRHRRERRFFSRLQRSERGQMLLVFALLVIPVSFVLGAVAVDASMWQSERRGAQKDADLAALAGALELIDQSAGASAVEDAARDAASEYQQTNDEAGNAGIIGDIEVDNSCFETSRLDAVTIDVSHGSRTFFAEIFGIDVAPEIGAHAKACVGSLNNPEGVRPFILDMATSPCFVAGAPLFGEACTMDFGSQGSAGDSNRGVADLEVPDGTCSNGPGDGDLEDMIENGAQNVACWTNTGNSCSQMSGAYTNCVVGQTGNVANKTIDGIRALLSREGGCDAAYGPGPNEGVDDFEEALELLGGGTAPPSPDNVYVPRPCNADGDTSARLITIFAVDEWLGSNQPMPIRYFVTMYVQGCQRDDGTLNITCQGSNGPPGHVQLRGIIIKAFLTGAGDIGAPNEGGSLKTALVE